MTGHVKLNLDNVCCSLHTDQLYFVIGLSLFRRKYHKRAFILPPHKRNCIHIWNRFVMFLTVRVHQCSDSLNVICKLKFFVFHSNGKRHTMSFRTMKHLSWGGCLLLTECGWLERSYTSFDQTRVIYIQNRTPFHWYRWAIDPMGTNIKTHPFMRFHVCVEQNIDFLRMKN